MAVAGSFALPGRRPWYQARRGGQMQARLRQAGTAAAEDKIGNEETAGGK
jgi:hypothetical protein